MRIVRTTALTSVLAVAALVGASTAPAVAASPAAHQRPAVAVHVFGKHSVHAPRHTQPGLVRVRNTGTRAVLVFDPLKSAGAATLAKEMNAANSDSGSLDFTRDFAVVDLLAPRTTVYLRLLPGVDYLLDASANNYTAADVTTLRVTGAKRNAVAPKSTGAKIMSNGKLAPMAKKKIGKNASLRVLNKSKHLADVFIASVGKDVSDRKLNKFLAHPSFKGLFKIDTAFDLNILGVISPHRAFLTQLHSKAGRHLLISLQLTGGASEPTLRAGQVRLLNLK